MIFSIFCGILWNKIISEIVVSALNFVGIVFNISKSFLAMVVLSIGNALPDGLTTISIAKKGNASVVVTGGIACHLFSLLIGMGTTTLIKIISSEKELKKPGFIISFNLWPDVMGKDNKIMLGIIFSALLTQVTILIYSFLSNFTLKKPLSYFLFANYLITFGYCLFVTIK